MKSGGKGCSNFLDAALGWLTGVSCTEMRTDVSKFIIQNARCSENEDAAKGKGILSCLPNA